MEIKPQSYHSIPYFTWKDFKEKIMDNFVVELGSRSGKPDKFTVRDILECEKMDNENLDKFWDSLGATWGNSGFPDNFMVENVKDGDYAWFISGWQGILIITPLTFAKRVDV